MSVEAPIAYVGKGGVRPRYHANDISRDVVPLAPRLMPIEDARGWATPASLDVDGFVLLNHCSVIDNFLKVSDAADRHAAEVRTFLLAISGADEVVVGPRPILRFSERTGLAGRLDNSRPARFAHIDISDATAAQFAAGAAEGRPLKRYCHYNVWRAFTGEDQDVPLALCDARSVAAADLIAADAVFDTPGQAEWSFEGIVVAHSLAHRWRYFRGMTRDEVIVFKTNDSDPTRAHAVPHVAFDDPTCPPDAPPRASVEMRGTALWFA